MTYIESTILFQQNTWFSDSFYCLLGSKKYTHMYTTLKPFVIVFPFSQRLRWSTMRNLKWKRLIWSQFFTCIYNVFSSFIKDLAKAVTSAFHPVRGKPSSSCHAADSTSTLLFLKISLAYKHNSCLWKLMQTIGSSGMNSCLVRQK